MSRAVATMWLLLLLCCSHHQLLIAQADDRTVLMNWNNPCEGYVGIIHDGQLGYVGSTNWNDAASKVVCSSIQCGNPVKSQRMTPPWPFDKFWINEVNCTGEEAQLWKCKFPGFGVSHHQKDSLRYIQCSHEIELSLDGFECAGDVQYSVNGGKTYSGYICADGWEKKDADVLCKSLKCGTAKEIVTQQWLGWKGFRQKNKMMVKCSGIENVTHLWQCAVGERSSCQKPASVICTGHEAVQLRGNTSNVCSGQLYKEESGKWTPFQNNITDPDKWCQQMHCGTSSDLNGTDLTCSDNVKVVLKHNNTLSKCYGTVYVQVNDTMVQPVCGSSWDRKEAAVVCKELGCGKVHQHSTWTNKQTKGIMDNVRCSGEETSLWQCRAKRDHAPFQCPSNVYVVCTGSIGVRLKDGPGKCCGRVEIQHEGTWKRVSKKGWTNQNSETVCKLLDCGHKRENLKEFSQGSAEFLNGTLQCPKNNVAHISECIKHNVTLEKKAMAMAITCEEHKVVFLKGNKPCSGMVGIEQDTKTYWLSGSNWTWNVESANTVCQQMHCGNASNHMHINNTNEGKSIWKDSYSCSSNTKSLFDCQKTQNLSSDHEDTIAYVTCSGKITANLTNGCWGNVNVCLGKKCGGVCSDGWGNSKAVMLCEDLGCGNSVLKATSTPKESQVIMKSVHSTTETTNMTQCNFVTRDENDINYKCSPAYVVCSGSIKTKFSKLNEKCSGSVEMLYEGKWIPVCANALKDKNVQDTICGELKCGQASKLIDYFGPAGQGPFISEINCFENGNKLLAACNMTSQKDACKPGVLQCSDWRKMALTVGSACKGAATVLSEGKRSPIFFESWTERMGNMLCKHLGCGRLKRNESKYVLQSPTTTNFNCATVNDSESLWDCGSSNMESQSKQQLFIECQDEPQIILSEGCYGEVKINNLEVCATNWKENYSDMVCSEINCGGNAVASVSHDRMPQRNKDYHHVRCDDNDYYLGQCKRFKGKCDGNLVSVYCVGNVKFNTTEKCGGQIEVQYRDKWEKVCSGAPLGSEHLKKLCKEMNCGGHSGIQSKDNNDKVKSHLETTLKCGNENLDIKYCLHKELCETSKPAEIYCNGYEVPPTEPPKIVANPLWPKMMAVGLVLVVVILIVVLLRICKVKRAKKGQNVSPGRLSSKEDGFESGSYDEVMSKSNEMAELNRTRFRSETEVFAGNDAGSTSFEYDDIDEVAVVQPLTSGADTAGASGFRSETEVFAGNDAGSTSSFAYDDIDEVAVVQPLTSQADTTGASDGVTFEVYDQEENYDDVEACSGIIQTEAEIHAATQPATESDAAAPAGSELGDDNYMQPRRVSQS
uniref:SRCR domain-containing protein n=1 Tax=Gasterosteus aculeatus aculeatus TaxID=481459 RepID=A0AAQ4QP26_GASAC|nr:scavenger receptor cysteine-rich type 1 protein M130 isoform X2 [Gasterosteus aculeatus aculeatus]